ncbi:MAG: hypothetical protein JRI23_01865 [Deltaproteobacteria bacterium]|jgi:hypothetical protein|nr:hypothetical protein [Deltaproteobacteria bacterium]MBW2530221.1 hypothetical protein [Deltaproteobacteria bacterium]
MTEDRSEASSARGRGETAEASLRRKLAIPADAETVLLFGETSHWDPNWLMTSEQYYRWRIRHILDAVLDELEREPARVFSLECVFFLRMYWERRPDRHELIRELCRTGRLRLSGSGITTPDTVLPSEEAILRDYLLGQQWLRRQGIEAEPRLAYLPDCFGHSPALPALLRALGMDMAGVSRIDGMHFVGSDFRPQHEFPLAGSSAALLEELGTADFVWRAPDGSEVLCHWNPFNYFQGDMLAHRGIIRWMGVPFGIPWRTNSGIATRVRQLVDQLRPLAKTPYLFCPIGCDFNGPIPALGKLLDRYNRVVYPRTGVYAVSAGMDDYLALCSTHRASLPVLELDPNPYWMGFYASRPEAKQRSNRTVDKLLLAEKLLWGGNGDAQPRADRDGVLEALEEAWDLVAVSNHHDFITGTSPDRVWSIEQLPWLERAERCADQALSVAAELHDAPLTPRRSRAPHWVQRGGELTVRTPHYVMTLSEQTGGCIVSARLAGSARELCAGPANDLCAYRDSGGLWRFGHEYLGGDFREVRRTSDAPAIIEATERNGMLEVRIESLLVDRHVVRWLWFRDDTPILRMRVVGAAAPRHTIACRFPTTLGVDSLHMDVPGGVVERPRTKLYQPTYWPARSFAHGVEHADGPGVAAFLGGPACVALRERGELEWVVLRNAPREVAFGVLRVPAHPASGTDHGEHRFDYALWLTEGGSYLDNALFLRAREVLDSAWLRPGEPHLGGAAQELVQVDRTDVVVSALKAASHGTGFIARLRSFANDAEEVQLQWPARPIGKASLCDARERDLQELTVAEDGSVRVPVRQAITSVRIEPRCSS